jgi:methionyl-tRNA formyltransferase
MAGTGTLRLAFMGTPDFAVPSLRALLDAGHEVVRVYCQPPRPAGRGHKEKPCPVHAEAAARGLEIATPETLKDDDSRREFKALDLDAAVVVAYGMILPPAILHAPRLGCVNVHASLLPRWRGAAPIQRALLAGDAKTGVTIMQMDEGLDSGPMLARESVAVDTDTDAGALHDTLAEMGARLLPRTLQGLAAGTIEPEPQPDHGATYARKLSPEDRRIDWRRPAIELSRLARAFAPKPGATATLPDGETLKVLRADVAPGAAAGTKPGTVVDAGVFTVACGQGSLSLRRVQRAGKAPMDVQDFLRGYPLKAGDVLG